MKKERIQTYNALKGIGAIGILFSHMSYLSDSNSSFWKYLYDIFMSNGAAFATLFMILSGFFLQYSWKSKPFREYFRGKIKRVYPLTFCVFIMALLVEVLLSSRNITGKGVIPGSRLWYFNIAANVLLFKAFIPEEKTFYSFHGPSWYISVLVFLYAFAYPLLRGLNSDNKAKYLKLLKIICFASYSIELIACTAVKCLDFDSLWICYVNPWFRMFGEGFLGILICEYSDAVSSRLERYNLNQLEWLTVCLIVISLLIRNVTGAYCYFAALFQTIPMATTVLVFKRGIGTVSAVLKKDFFQFLGNISFELYMTHAFVYEGLPIIVGIISETAMQWLIAHAGTRFAITLFLAIATASIVKYVFDKLYNLKKGTIG